MFTWSGSANLKSNHVCDHSTSWGPPVLQSPDWSSIRCGWLNDWLIEWLIDLIGMWTYLGLFYAKKLGNRVHCHYAYPSIVCKAFYLFYIIIQLGINHFFLSQYPENSFVTILSYISLQTRYAQFVTAFMFPYHCKLLVLKILTWSYNFLIRIIIIVIITTYLNRNSYLKL